MAGWGPETCLLIAASERTLGEDRQRLLTVFHQVSLDPVESYSRNNPFSTPSDPTAPWMEPATRTLHTKKHTGQKQAAALWANVVGRTLFTVVDPDRQVRKGDAAGGEGGGRGQSDWAGGGGTGGGEEMVLERCALCVWCCLYACMLVGVYHVCIASVCGHVRRNIMCYAHTCMSV
jgi:hypothetical protein